jgi:hypothetical protein
VSLLSSICLLASASPLQGQNADQPWREASFTAGASFGDGETAIALTAALAFDAPRRLKWGFEIAYARKLDFTLDLCPPLRVCVIGGQLPVTGRTVSLLPFLSMDLSPATWRLRTYVHGGIGVGHLRQRYFLGPPVTGSDPPIEFTRSKVAVAWSYGGGVSVPVASRLALGADVRVLQLLDEEPSPERFITPSGLISTLRAGVRASWRF